MIITVAFFYRVYPCNLSIRPIRPKTSLSYSNALLNGAISLYSACVNFRRPEWGVFVQQQNFQILGKHAVYQVSPAHRMPSGVVMGGIFIFGPSNAIGYYATEDASSTGVEWNASVTAAGSILRPIGMV